MMAETYCGKSCGACTWKAQFQCAGCKSGPGRNIGGDCDVAVCARKKGHETCETCGYQGNCGTLRSRDKISFSRAQRMEADRLWEMEEPLEMVYRQLCGAPGWSHSDVHDGRSSDPCGHRSGGGVHWSGGNVYCQTGVSVSNGKSIPGISCCKMRNGASP